jgi:hypothetical protein
LAIVRIQCTGRWKQDFNGVFNIEPQRYASPMAPYLWGIATLGVGLTGRGVEHPPPLSRHVTGNGFR